MIKIFFKIQIILNQKKYMKEYIIMNRKQFIYNTILATTGLSMPFNSVDLDKKQKKLTIFDIADETLKTSDPQSVKFVI